MNYFKIWLSNFIENKKLFIAGIGLSILLIFSQALVEVSASMKSFYILTISMIAIAICTIIFLSLKKTAFVKFIYWLALSVASLFILVSLLEIFNIIDWVQYINVLLR